MDLKLDENLGRRSQEKLQQAGHAAVSVVDQGLVSASDRVVIQTCLSERRCLVTLDLGLANPLQFDPSEFAGIAVLRPPPKTTPSDLDHLIDVLTQGMQQRDVHGKLWIVQPGRISEYQPPDP